MTTRKHSVQRLPRLYKLASKIVQQVKEEGGSVKDLVYKAKHPNLKALYALVFETLKHGRQLDYLIRKTEILLKNPRLNPWVARVLMTELLWQKKASRAVSPPQEIVESYQEKFTLELAQIPEDEGNQDASKSSETGQLVRYIRVNTLKESMENVINWFINKGWEEVTFYRENKKASIKRAKELNSHEFRRDADIPYLLVFPRGFLFYDTELYNEGVIILQDKASCVPPLLLNPPPGSVVLDMCAAPGMKTSQIAAIMEDKGKVIAVEINRNRYANLCKTAEICGATCVQTVNDDVLRYSGPEMKDVEYILLDPPCSGSGMMIRKDVFEEKAEKDAHRLSKLANFQCSLLRYSMTNFPKVKRIVYSTCSVHREENEAVVDSVLKSIPPNFFPVRDPPSTEWMERGSSDYEFGDCGFYTRPATHSTNGFFVMVFERSDREYVPSSKFSAVHPANIEEKSVPVKMESKQKKKKVAKDGIKKEEKSIEPDDVVQKMMRAMQKKPETDLSESHPDVGSGVQNHSAKKKKKRNKSKIDQDDGVSSEPAKVDSPGVSTDVTDNLVETAVVEEGGAEETHRSRKRKKKSLKLNGKEKKIKQ